MKFPVSRVTVNLAPADTKKAGTLYDLPVLIGILLASENMKTPAGILRFFSVNSPFRGRAPGAGRFADGALCGARRDK